MNGHNYFSQVWISNFIKIIGLLYKKLSCLLKNINVVTSSVITISFTLYQYNLTDITQTLQIILQMLKTFSVSQKISLFFCVLKPGNFNIAVIQLAIYKIKSSQQKIKTAFVTCAWYMPSQKISMLKEELLVVGNGCADVGWRG